MRRTDFISVIFVLLLILGCALGQQDGSSSLTPTEKDKRWGFVNKSGDFVIPPQFDWASSFSEGQAAVLVDNKYGFIDETGAVVIQPRYTDFGGFSGGLACVKVGGATIPRRAGSYAREIMNEEWRYIDRFDNAIIRIWAYRAGDFSEGLASVTISMPGGEDTACGYIDRQGLWAIEPRFLKCEPFSNGVAQVRLNGEQRQIDKQGYFIAERK